jgi:hypothetical protein
MAQIFAVKDLEDFLKNPVFQKYCNHLDTSACIALPSMDGLDQLKAGTIQEILPALYSEDERKAFIRDYTQFIASLNLSYKDQRLWWASDLSSKNRYLSPLPDLLQELLEIERALQIHKDKTLFVIAPSIAIYPALQKAAAKIGRKLLWPGAQARFSLQRVRGALRSAVRPLANAARFYIRALWARWMLGSPARRWLTPQKEFYVIKTFSYPSSWDEKGNYTDTFFGRLPEILSKDKNVVVLSYHWQGFRPFIQRALADNSVRLFPVEFFLKASDIFSAVLKIFTFQLPMKKKLYFRSFDVTDVLVFELSRTLNGVQLFQLLHYDAIGNMLKWMRFETFLFTFENNPWERMCILSLRHYSPSTKIIGYQHSVVPEAALNMFVHSSEKNIVPLPDMVLTTGDVPKDILQNYGDYSAVPVKTACALRYGYLFDIKPMARQENPVRLLLVLDGVEQTKDFLGYILEQIQGQERYRLRVRCHPALPWDWLSRKFHFDISNLANVEVSSQTLHEDLSWADAVIYWQTTIALEAICWGKPVVNFKPGDILSYDPLFQTNALKWTATPQEKLLYIVKAVEQLDDQTYRRQLDAALLYIRRYFHPLTPQALQLFQFDV